jgi:hypothetical protein
MPQLKLVERVTALEKQVAQLQSTVEHLVQPKDWRRTIGAFTDDEVMKQVFAEAMKIREADRKQARLRYAKERRARE